MRNIPSSGYRTSERYREKIAIRMDPNRKSHSPKKRKAGFFIIAGNIAILVIIFFVAHTQREPQGLYKTVSFATEQSNFRFTIVAEHDADHYIITLTVDPIINGGVNFTFNENVADINFIYNNINVLSIPLGEHITKLELRPTEVRTFTTSLNMKKLNAHILDRGNYKPRVRKHIFDFEGTTVLVNAQLTINTPEEIIQTIQFRTGNLK